MSPPVGESWDTERFLAFRPAFCVSHPRVLELRSTRLQPETRVWDQDSGFICLEATCRPGGLIGCGRNLWFMSPPRRLLPSL